MALEAIGTSAVSELAKDLTKDLLVTVKRQAGYFLCFNNIAKNLGIEKEKLELKQQGLLQRARDANKNTEQITGEARKWLEEAEKHIKGVDNLEAERKMKRKCFLGWCPNCIWQYRLGRKMAEKIEEVVGHLGNSEFNYFSRLRTLTGQGLDSSDNFIYFESRNVAYVQLLEALSDSRNFRIGLCGMGGLGKTSLVKEVQKEVVKSKSFDKVVFVVVSNPPDVRKIQEEIAESLRLKFEEQYESNRAQRLCMRLTSGEKILLILDDVWRPLDFNTIGIPFDNSHQGYCRVLLTTREAKVCRSTNCQVKIDLELLSRKDAWILFEKHANISEETSPTRLRVVAQDIAEQCKGLPVAIAAAASTLKDQYLPVWEGALTTLKDSKPLDNIDEDLVDIYRCLKLSYDNLKNERAEKLFLLCSLFPADYQIPTEDLVRYGIGLGIFGDEDSYETLRFQVWKAINKLIDSCMLLNASFERESVKMRDLVRDVAHLIANKKIQVVIGLKKNLKAVLENVKSKDIVECLWLHTDRIHETPELLNCTKPNILDQLNSPQLKILEVIVDTDHFVDVDDIFFKGMDSLQVLTLRGDDPEEFRFCNTMQIPELINLRTLRLKNWYLRDISVIGNLKRLETLELEYCMIIELPDGILELKKLRLLGLFNCSVQKNPFGVMGRFSQLEELYFTKVAGFSSQWKVDGESISEFFDEKCCLRKLKRYHIEIGGDCNLSGSMNYLQPRGLYIEHLDASTSNATIKDLLQRAKILHLQDVQGDYKSITPDIAQAVGGLNELIELGLFSCLEIECLLDTTNHSSEKGAIFSNLVTLSLGFMHSLKELCHGPSPPDFLQKLGTLHLIGCSKLQSTLFAGNLSLCNLKLMTVGVCPALTSLFTLSTAHSLELLEKVEIIGCRGLKYIIADQRGRENEDNIVQEKDEHDQKISADSIFPKLKYISIDRCESLEWIFPLSFAGGLKQLEEMLIWNAAKLKHIFGQYQHEDHRLHGNAREIILPSLRTMAFFNVPNFVSVFPIYYQPSDQPLQSTDLELTALATIKYLNVEDCPRLPEEYQNAGKEAEYEEEEELKLIKALRPNPLNALALNKGKRPVGTIFSSNGGKDPQTSGMGTAEDSHSEEKEGKEAKPDERGVALTANPIDGRDTAPQIVTNGRSDIVHDIPPRFSPGPSSETLLSSVSLPPPNHALPSQVDPEEYANFRDIGAVKKKHIPLLEEAITKYPSLWAWRDQKSMHPKMIQFGYDILADMLEFLASTRWRDLKEDKKAEFDSLVNGLKTFEFNIQWLEKTCAMVEQSRFDEEIISRVQTLEAQVMEQETEVKVLLERVQMAEAKLNKTRSELDAIKGDVGNFNDFIGF